ncbi:MAG TPA: CoA pyrophosphatase [Candidatus Dormibacteraeota bacterium]|nr:CoA pyrophosphatase [Candidatus Dormibacteraeota bacterium]
MRRCSLRSALETNLRGLDRVRSGQALKPAAVAIVVLDDGGHPAIPIFQRTSDMSRHAGQMALPGGRLHEGESAEACAIRELYEELGLAVRPDDVVGLLDDFDTRSGFTITPVVMCSGAAAAALQPSTFEVAQLFVIHLEDLRVAVSQASHGPSSDFSLQLPQVQVFAPTAAILYQFSEVALDGRSVRVADFYQPPFTHR